MRTASEKKMILLFLAVSGREEHRINASNGEEVDVGEKSESEKSEGGGVSSFIKSASVVGLVTSRRGRRTEVDGGEADQGERGKSPEATPWERREVDPAKMDLKGSSFFRFYSKT
jgi:hypothetical protein